MPIAVAALIRVLIQATVQTGIFLALDAILAPLIDKAKAAVKSTFNLNDDDATDVIANHVIDAFAMIGIIGVGIKTKLPTIVAEKLGFTSKGYVKRTLSPKVPVAATAAKVTEVTTAAATKVLTQVEAQTVVDAAIKSKIGFKEGYDMLIKHVGLLFLGFMVVGNWLDFGNWQNGAYQKSMQKFISWITFGKLVPDADYRKSLTISDAIFSKIFNTLKIGGAQGIQDPYKGVDVPFTRENLLDLTDKVGASLLLTDGTASAKKVLTAVLPMIIFDTSVDLDKILADAEATTPTTANTVSVAPITKVFTGIVSQGVVGQGLVFTPRPDDLIESAEELRQAAANNLAPFLSTLLGKIVYEVKVVSSIITKEGFRQNGTSQRIVSGTNSDGTPKYKTVTNKFATLVVYALTDKGSRAKLTTIVLGPTNSAKLTVAQTDLRTLETELPSLVTTNSINDIKGIETASPVTVTTPPSAGGTSVPVPNTVASGQPAPVSNTTTPSTAVLGAGATTLAEWYQAQGQTLPSVAERSVIYGAFALGPASYYTGTAEQNTRLLNSLKANYAAYGHLVLPGVTTSAPTPTTTQKPTVTTSTPTPIKATLQPPDGGTVDSTGKKVKGWSLQSSGAYLIFYSDGSQRLLTA